MKSRWDDSEARAWQERAGASADERLLALRVYTSRLIGKEIDLVLHGGGNTSVKVSEDGRRVLHVKGSGWDLATIDAPGLPGLKLDPLLTVRGGPRLSDPDMVALLRSEMIDQSGPNPSVETLLHAFLPAAFVDHTHAAAALVVANQPNAADLAQTIFGDRIAIVPYVMPGFDLSIEAVRCFEKNPGCEGLFLVNHGLFSFAEDARTSYERMLEFTTDCEAFLVSNGASLPGPESKQSDRSTTGAETLSRLAEALRDYSVFANGLALDLRCNNSIDAFLALPNLEDVAGRGTITPDHVIRLKPWPLIGAVTFSSADWKRQVEEFTKAYSAYFERHAPHADEPKTMLDALPRSVLIRGLGVVGVGRNEKEARICGDLLEQAARVVVAAEKLGRFSPINESQLFEMEYWSLEQAKLKNA